MPDFQRLTKLIVKHALARRRPDAEAAQLFRTMVAYAGKYRIEGDKIIQCPRSPGIKHSLVRN
jgi:hypothetical protein